MANSSVLLEVTPGLSKAAAVNGLLIAILIEHSRISFAMFPFVNRKRMCWQFVNRAEINNENKLPIINTYKQEVRTTQ